MKLPEAERYEFLPLFQEHLPKTLSDLAFDKVKDLVPEQYIINAIASRLASKMVYKGMHYISMLSLIMFIVLSKYLSMD